MRNVLFDLDGTLTDPQVGIVTSVLYALEKMGRPAPPAEGMAWIIGPPLQKTLPILLGTEDGAEVARCLGFYRERFAEVGLFENEVYEGIEDVLADLKSQGKRLFVATSKPKIFADRILAHFELEGHFEATYGSELDGTRTDKADVIGYALESSGLDPRDSLMVGDRQHDVLGALTHGMPCLGVLYGYGSREELSRAGAWGLCETPLGLLDSVRLLDEKAQLAGDADQRTALEQGRE